MLDCLCNIVEGKVPSKKVFEDDPRLPHSKTSVRKLPRTSW
jgi:hypothetical protein